MATEKAIFAAGCFWGIEHAFRSQKGVLETISGYTGGHIEAPTYEQVGKGDTGHAEAVEVTFDPAVVSYEQLLNLFWDMHDPTTLNRQGPDVGTQYRSALFTLSADQQKKAIASKEAQAKKYAKPIVTEILPAKPFYPAEERHQRYFEKHGRSCY
jgi:peptide-methionine (S)-S-oxide reductase